MENPSLVVAFLAGLAYFFSPCTLPLLPSYLIFLSGVSLPEISGGKRRLTVFLNALFFLLGFLFLFVVLGAGATLLGNVLGRHVQIIRQAGGVIIAVMGVLLIWKPGFLGRFSFGRSRTMKPAGLFGSFLVGLSFSAAWTGCSSPVLGAILVTAAVSETVRQGIRLLVFFGLGLAVPFLVSALLMDFLLAPLKKLQRHLHKIEVALGVIFILFGLRLILGPLAFHFG